MRFAVAHPVTSTVIAAAILGGVVLALMFWPRGAAVRPPTEAATVIPTPFVGSTSTSASPSTPVPTIESDGDSLEPPTTEDGIPVIRGTPRLISYGAFEAADGTARVAGRAFLIELTPDVYLVRIEDLAGVSGDNLQLYLSNDAHGYGSAVIGLGGLGDGIANATYEVPAGAGVSSYRSVVIWDASTSSVVAVGAFYY